MGCDDHVSGADKEPQYFNPRIPYGMRPPEETIEELRKQFQSTHPVWDATTRVRLPPKALHISIHASRMGCDRRGRWRRSNAIRFQSTHPVWDATYEQLQRISTALHFNPRIPYGMRLYAVHLAYMDQAFQSTHPVWDATGADRRVAWTQWISIHASRMGCDLWLKYCFRLACHFNPRIPYGMRPHLPRLRVSIALFQSTHPVWDATSLTSIGSQMLPFQSTHPVWDATSTDCCTSAILLFQSTHPVWDATGLAQPRQRDALISIHASRMGCDLASKVKSACREFQSTHPVWDATYFKPSDIKLTRFQSTHPVWDATSVGHRHHTPFMISIHASRMGCDWPCAATAA